MRRQNSCDALRLKGIAAVRSKAWRASASHSILVICGLQPVFGDLAGGGDLPDRLLVDLGGGGRAVVSSWPDGGLPEEVARAPLEWPLDAPALEDLRW
jgi:hypothetical protein